MNIVRDLGEGVVYWSPRLASSIEQAIARAGVVGGQRAELRGASLFSDTRAEITVRTLSPVDWVVSYQDKKYLVLTDERGCVLSALMPDYGVAIERRASFAETKYPLWPPYGAPPDNAYRVQEVGIRAPGGRVLAGYPYPSRREKARLRPQR